MTTGKTVNAWEIFLRRFKLNDEVCVIDDFDSLYCGRLTSFNERSCTITSQGRRRKSVRILWASVRLMCHDGFPIRELRSADGSPKIMDEDSVANEIRTALFEESDFVFGDPFHIEGVRATLYNRGNDGWENFEQDDEEILEMVSADGAIGHLWDLNTVFWCKV